MPELTDAMPAPLLRAAPPVLPFGEALAPGRHGMPTGEAGVSVAPLVLGAVDMVTARRGRTAELVAALSALTGRTVTDRPAVWATPCHRVIGVAPGRFQIFGLAPDESAGLDPVAWRVDQRGSVAAVRLSGRALPEVLARGIAVDLHPSVFPPGNAAVTLLDHLPVTLIRLPDRAGRPVFELLTGRSQARGLARWLREAGAAEGVEIGPAETDLAGKG